MRWLLFSVASLAAGCGGKAVVDGPIGGGGGAGGQAGSTTSTTGSGGSTASCAHHTDCGDCVSCVLAGPCGALYDALQSDPDVDEFWGCFHAAGCGSAPDWLACVTPCAQAHPSGHASLLTYYECVECEQCPVCDGWTKYYGCP